MGVLVTLLKEKVELSLPHFFGLVQPFCMAENPMPKAA